MSTVREEMIIVFGVDQTQIDNVLRTMPVKFAASGRRAASALENEFKGIGGRIGASIVGGITGGLTAMLSGGIFQKINQQIEQTERRAKDIRLGVLRTDLSPAQFTAGKNVFDTTLGDGRFESSLEKVGDAVAKFREGGEVGEKMAGALIELGASLATIQSGDYKAVFFQIADNMQSAALSAEKIAALRDVFGRGGPELTLAFRKGFGGALAGTGIPDAGDLAESKAEEKSKEDAGFIGAELKKNWLFSFLDKLGDAPKEFTSIFAEMFGATPGRIGDRSGNDRFLAEQKAEKEKEKLKALEEQRKIEKQQKEDAKRDAEFDKEADRLNESTAERNHRMAQKQLTLEEQIAQAKKMQTEFEKKSAEILNKKLETITALDRRNAAAAAADAKKFEEEAAARQKELDAKKKEFQEQSDDAQRRLEKAETDRARTEAERYGMSIGDMTARGLEDFDPAQGIRGRRARRNARRGLARFASNLSPAEQYDVSAAREIESAREFAKFAAAYGQFEEAEMARRYADDIAQTLNFAKPSEAEWFRTAEEAIVESRRTLQSILDKAEGEGIHIKPRMGR